MFGYIIYSINDYKRNEWFANHFVFEFKKYNIELKIIVIETIENLKYYEIPDFVINRVFSSEICRYYESKNVRCFNNYKTSYYGNNKYECYKLADYLNIPHLKVYKYNENVDYPYVLKSNNGHGGSEVFLIKNKNSEIEIDDYDKYIKQEVANTTGCDMRVYCFDGKIIETVIRYSNNDFRSNYSLGGTFKESKIESYQKDYVSSIVKCLSPDFIGIDFVLHNDNWYFNEIEDIVGTRILYEMNKFDIISMYCEYIYKVLNKER